MTKALGRFGLLSSIGLLLLTACSSPTENDSGEFTPYNTIPMTAEAEWARRVASLRVDDAGTNNGRTRIAILEVLLGIRERLVSQGVTPELRQDLDVAQGALERMYASANTAARGEWQVVSRDFVRLQNQLDNPQEAIRTLDQIIARLSG
jgi:hypothetical protein